MSPEMESSSQIDFFILVDKVSNDFEHKTGIKVLPEARKALIYPAIAHKDHVEKELLKGNITIKFLMDSLLKVLENSEIITRDIGSNEINLRIIQISMDRYCPYLFWC